MQVQLLNTAQEQVLEAQALAARKRVSEAGAGTDKAANDYALRKAAEDFEAVFLSQMLQPMFDTIPKDGMFSGGNAEDIYRGMMVQETGKAIAANGGVGIADNVYHELLKLQEQ